MCRARVQRNKGGCVVCCTGTVALRLERHSNCYCNLQFLEGPAHSTSSQYLVKGTAEQFSFSLYYPVRYCNTVHD